MMENLNRPLGCGLWLVWLSVGLFSAEWLLLWSVAQILPKVWLLPGVMGVVILTILVGWVVVYIRLQRWHR